MRIQFPIICSGLASMVAACTTTLLVNPVPKEPSEHAEGWTYSLPMVRYEVAVIRTLASCSPFTLDYTVTAAPKLERDPRHSYTVDPETLSSWSKVSDIGHSVFPNGMLKDLNAAAEDQTGQVIVNTVTGVAKLAEAAAKTAVLFDNIPSDCNPGIDAKIKDRDAAAADTEVKTVALENSVREYTALAGLAPLLGKEVPKDFQDKLVQKAEAVVEAQKSLDLSQVALKEKAAVLSKVQSFRWPEDSNVAFGVQGYAAENLAGWSTQLKDTDLSVYLRLVPTSLYSVTPPAGNIPEPTGLPKDGIRYRVPAVGVLEVSACAKPGVGVNADNGFLPSAADALVASQIKCDSQTLVTKRLSEGPLPQLGRIFFLPYHNGIFQNNVLEATFSEDGSLLTSKYSEKVSRAVVASDTLNKTAEALSNAVPSVQAAAANAKTAVYNAETAALKAKAERDKAKLALEPPLANDAEEVAIINSNTALLNAAKAQIDAEMALKEARDAALAATSDKEE